VTGSPAYPADREADFAMLRVVMARDAAGLTGPGAERLNAAERIAPACAQRWPMCGCPRSSSTATATS
jgi:hypothetical protein